VLKVYEFLKKKSYNFGRAIRYDFKLHLLSKNPQTSTKEILSNIELDNKEGTIQCVENNNIVCPSFDYRAIEPKEYEEVQTYFKDIDDFIAKIIHQDIIEGTKLSPEQWVNDNVINIYFKYILQPWAETRGKNIVLVDTYFFQRLFMDNKIPGCSECKTICEQAIPYWKGGGDIYIIPINIHNTHWTLITVHVKGKTIAYHDALGIFNGIDGNEFMKSIFLFLREYQFYIDGNYDNAPDEEAWTFYDASHFYLWDNESTTCLNAPQKNSYDCGIFVIKFAELCVEFESYNLSEIIMENFS